MDHPRRGLEAAAMTVVAAIRRRIPLWLAYLALGGLGVGIHLNLEPAGALQNVLYDVVGASAVVVALLGVVRNRTDRPLPWILIAVGQGLFVLGDVLWNLYEFVGEDPFPSFADVLYLAAYPFIAVGLLLLIRRRIGDGDRGGLLDAAILTAAAATLSWTFLIRPKLLGSELDSMSLMISVAYPVFDLALIGVAMGLLTTPGARTASFRFLAISLGVMLAADHLYLVQNLDDTYVPGGPVDTLYLVAYVLFGVAAAHPSMRLVTEPHPVPVTWLGPIRIVGLATAMITGPTLVAVGPNADGGMTVIAVGTASLSLLVLARLVGMVGILGRDVAKRRALEAQLTHQAFHDPLTGLMNRRGFLDAAEAAISNRTATGTVAALFLDLDDFKTVNDSRGHGAGDAVLVAIAQRIGANLRSTDVAARLGGDEFGVLLTGIPDAAFPAKVAERLLGQLASPIRIPDVSVNVGSSVGIAIDRAATRTVDDLLGDADVAMYQAKGLGKGRYQVFAPATDHGTSPRPRTSETPSPVRPSSPNGTAATVRL